MPAFAGLFAPYWRSDARGVIAGLTGYVTKGHIARAVLEAMAWQTREVVDAMAADAGAPLTALKVDGGMTANNLLMQFQADVLDVPVVRPAITETTAWAPPTRPAWRSASGRIWRPCAPTGARTPSGRRRWRPSSATAEYRQWKKAVAADAGLGGPVMSAPGFSVPSQAGRRAIVTGTGGLGYETALALAGAGADVILAGRNPDKGAASVSAILRAHPSAAIRFEALDLASLASVATFAERTLAEDAPLHLLVNNAGVMALPRRRVSADGFELQFATNYLGHFALTARLLPRLMATPGARVVSLSSLYAGMGSAIDFEDLQAERTYRPYRSYGQSKLAMLMFARELARRVGAAAPTW